MTFCPQPKMESLARHRARKRRVKAKQMRQARAQVMPEDTRCACGRVATEAHHRRFRSLGGLNVAENLEPTCWACHQRRHRRSA